MLLLLLLLHSSGLAVWRISLYLRFKASLRSTCTPCLGGPRAARARLLRGPQRSAALCGLSAQAHASSGSGGWSSCGLGLEVKMGGNEGTCACIVHMFTPVRRLGSIQWHFLCFS